MEGPGGLAEDGDTAQDMDSASRRPGTPGEHVAPERGIESAGWSPGGHADDFDAAVAELEGELDNDAGVMGQGAGAEGVAERAAGSSAGGPRDSLDTTEDLMREVEYSAAQEAAELEATQTAILLEHGYADEDAGNPGHALDGTGAHATADPDVAGDRNGDEFDGVFEEAGGARVKDAAGEGGVAAERKHAAATSIQRRARGMQARAASHASYGGHVSGDADRAPDAGDAGDEARDEAREPALDTLSPGQQTASQQLFALIADDAMGEERGSSRHG